MRTEITYHDTTYAVGGNACAMEDIIAVVASWQKMQADSLVYHVHLQKNFQKAKKETLNSNNNIL